MSIKLRHEIGTVFKEKGGRINVCLCYPNDYSVGMSNLGFQGIYAMLNDRDDTVCERAFCPPAHDSSQTLSEESHRPLTDFDVLGFSIAFENDYPNIVRMLMSAKIPLKSSERSENYPLLIAGGACCFFNPEPFAEIFDLIFVGEAEDSLTAFLDAFSFQNKQVNLSHACNIEGVYVPMLSKGVKKSFKSDLTHNPMRTQIITKNTTFADMALVELMRGCQWNCRFCVVSSIYKPVRSKPLHGLIDEIQNSKKYTKRIGLVGPSLSDYKDIMQVLALPDVEFSITSIRATEGCGQLIKAIKAKSISIAPEAGSQRMRDIIGKRVTEGEILQTAAFTAETNIQTLRLYFIVGLPFEKEEDIEAIALLIKKIKKEMHRNLTVTLSHFVPKPFTPFTWAAMQKPEVIKVKIHKIKKMLLDVRGLKITHDDSWQAVMQGLLARGNRSHFKLLLSMAEGRSFKNAIKHCGIDLNTEVFSQRKFDEIFAWDYIDNGIAKERLYESWQNAAIIAK